MPRAFARPAETPSAQHRIELLREFAARMRDDDPYGALEIARRFRSLFPGEPAMTYNEACLDCRLGDLEGAMDDLAAAFELGYDDVRQAAVDPDLEPLHGDEAFRELLDRTVERLGAAAAARRIEVADGRWSPPLTAAPDRSGSPEMAVRVMFTAEGMRIESKLTFPSGGSWRDGDVLLVTAAPLPDAGGFDSPRPFRFACGRAGEVDYARFESRPGRVIREPVAELTARIDSAGDGAAVCILDVPWSLMKPFAPPVDLHWGVNAAWMPVRGAAGPRLAADPAGDSLTARWVRIAPVSLLLGPDSPERFGGRPDDVVVGREPVLMTLEAWTSQSGTGKLETNIYDIKDQPLVRGEAAESEVEIEPGLNRWMRPADLSQLPDGPFRFFSRLTLPDGRTAEWETPLLRFGGRWLPAARDRLKTVDPLDVPSVNYRLGLIEEALAMRDPRGDPSALATTINEVDNLLLRDSRTGSILPDGTDFVAAIDPGDGGALPCSLHLPVGWDREKAHPVLLILAGDGNRAQAVWDALAAGLDADDPDPNGFVLAQPRLRPPARGPWPDSGRQDLIAAAEWLRARFPGRPLRIAALENSAATGLDLALDYPGLAGALFLAPDESARPWPAAASDRFTGRGAGAPVTLALARSPSRTTVAVHDALARGGVRIVPRNLVDDKPATLAAALLEWLALPVE